MILVSRLDQHESAALAQCFEFQDALNHDAWNSRTPCASRMTFVLWRDATVV